MIGNHTGKTIVFGKFSPFTRPFTSFLAGAQGVSRRTFWFYNIIGGVFWVASSLLLGYLFGASYHVAAQYFGKIMVVAIVVIVVILWGFRIINSRFHIFKKYELFMLILNVFSLWALAKTIQDSFSVHSFMSNFDIAANLFMAKHVTPFVAELALWVSALGDTTNLIGLGIIIGCVFLYKKKWRRGVIMLFSILSASGTVVLLKEFFQRVRPHDALVMVSGGSFPSGHATIAAAFFVSLAYVITPRMPSLIKREMFIVGCVILATLIGVSRVVINVHWASDVIAGWALGIFLASASVLFVRYAAIILLRDSK